MGQPIVAGVVVLPGAQATKGRLSNKFFTHTDKA